MVLLYVGRFTSVKRVPVLIRAFAQARARFERPASLVVWGGSPGEFGAFIERELKRWTAVIRAARIEAN